MAELRVEFDLAHPLPAVWRALTDAELLRAWFMPTDLTPEVGSGFILLPGTLPGFLGPVEGELVELLAPIRVVMRWQGEKLCTRVAWELTPTGAACRLAVTQTGFIGAPAALRIDALQTTYAHLFGERLPAVLARVAAGLPPTAGVAPWRPAASAATDGATADDEVRPPAPAQAARHRLLRGNSTVPSRTTRPAVAPRGNQPVRVWAARPAALPSPRRPPAPEPPTRGPAATPAAASGGAAPGFGPGSLAAWARSLVISAAAASLAAAVFAAAAAPPGEPPGGSQPGPPQADGPPRGPGMAVQPSTPAPEGLPGTGGATGTAGPAAADAVPDGGRGPDQGAGGGTGSAAPGGDPGGAGPGAGDGDDAGAGDPGGGDSGEGGSPPSGPPPSTWPPATPSPSPTGQVLSATVASTGLPLLGGRAVEVTVANPGPADADGWEVTMSVAGQQVTHLSGAAYARDGDLVTFTPVEADLPAGEEDGFRFRLQAPVLGLLGASDPTQCRIDGRPCA